MTLPARLPDTSWISRVHALMSEIGREYSTASISRQRELAGAVVAQLSLALTELGVFDDEAASAQEALGQLLLMIRDLEHSRRHPWSIPNNVGGSRYEPRGDREVRLWAIAAVELLRAAGVGAEEAYGRVKAKLAAAGHKYRSAKKWHTDFKRSPRDGDNERVASILADRRTTGTDPITIANDFIQDPGGVLLWLVRQS